MVYECFNNHFPYHGGSPDLNIPPITIDDITSPDKIACYTPDLIPDAIFISSEKYVSTLTTPYDYSQVRVITSDELKAHHPTKKDNPVHGKVQIGYFSRQHDGKICYKKPVFIDPRILMNKGKFITVMVLI